MVHPTQDAHQLESEKGQIVLLLQDILKDEELSRYISEIVERTNEQESLIHDRVELRSRELRNRFRHLLLLGTLLENEISYFLDWFCLQHEQAARDTHISIRSKVKYLLSTSDSDVRDIEMQIKSVTRCRSSESRRSIFDVNRIKTLIAKTYANNLKGIQDIDITSYAGVIKDSLLRAFRAFPEIESETPWQIFTMVIGRAARSCYTDICRAEKGASSMAEKRREKEQKESAERHEKRVKAIVDIMREEKITTRINTFRENMSESDQQKPLIQVYLRVIELGLEKKTSQEIADTLVQEGLFPKNFWKNKKVIPTIRMWKFRGMHALGLSE